MKRPWILLPLLAAACSPATAEDDDEVRVLAAAARSVPDLPLEEVRFERCGGSLMEFVRVDQLLAAGAGMQDRWPLEARRRQNAARQGGEEPSPDEVYLLDNGTRSRTVRWNDDLFFFVFTRSGAEGPYELFCADTTRGRPVLVDSLDATHTGTEAIGVSWGAFDVAPCGERLLVVYGTPSDAYGSPSYLRQAWGTLTGDGLEFSPPAVIFEGEAGDIRVFDVQLLESEGRVDLLWQMGERLAYSSVAKGESTWAEAQVLSETSRSRSASLASEGSRIYVAWSDRRYESMEGWAFINGEKLMLCQSTDGGASFGEAVLLGSKSQRSDSHGRTLLAFRGEDPLLFAQQVEAVRWDRFVLDVDLSGYASLEPVSRSQLKAAYEARLRPLLEAGD